ncbi:hypothetical protein K461DRAFT_269771 [Myriangium duriaei CBS 260.36]|uniref:Rhodopsin domain-containing protein n=1 Tax=Myriangium duriaei CBS 260.36 TaxID=1168546 RepID=A0A9P4MJZ9_9PEZI|nr:hypothetical protein K461DRAFT_269771 [Myriangium duriaei CBS 260.36]
MAINILGLIVIDYGGVGHHLIAVFAKDQDEVRIWAQCLYSLSMLYICAVTIPKLSILVFFSRIFVEQYQIITTYILMGLLMTWAIGGGLAGVFICTPIEFFWNKQIEGTCVNIKHYYSYGGVPNIIVDFFMLILPLPMVWSFQASMKVKAGLLITLLIGSVGFVAAILRTVEFMRHDPIADGTWASSLLWSWTIIEPGAYIIATSAYRLRPLFRYLVDKSPSGHQTENQSSQGYTRTRSPHSDNNDISRETSISLIERGNHGPAYPLSSYPGSGPRRYGEHDEDDIFIGI